MDIHKLSGKSYGGVPGWSNIGKSTQSSKCTVRNHQFTKSMTLSWHTFIHAWDWIWYTAQYLNIFVVPDMNYYAKGNQDVLKIYSQGPSMSTKYNCVLDTLLFMLGNWKLRNNSIIKHYFGKLCHKWPLFQISNQEPSTS